MYMTSLDRRRPTALALALLLGLAACGDDGDDASDTTTAISSATSTPGTASPSTEPAPATTEPVAITEPTETSAATEPTEGTATTEAPTATEAAGSTEAAEATVAATQPDETTATSEPAPPGTYVVVEGDSLIGIATDNDVTLDELIDANGWEDGADHLILPGDVVQLPGAASDDGPAPASGTTTPGADGAPELDDLPPGVVPADEALEIELTDGASTPIAEPLVDGVYHATDPTLTADGTAVELRLGQFLTTEACEDRLRASTVPDGTYNEVTCLGYQVIDTPSADIAVPIADGPPVILLLAAPAGEQILSTYETTIEGWVELREGDGPTWAEYWLPGDALIEVVDGEVTRIEVSIIGS